MESYTPKELVRAPARLGAEVNYELEFEKSDDGYVRAQLVSRIRILEAS